MRPGPVSDSSAALALSAVEGAALDSA